MEDFFQQMAGLGAGIPTDWERTLNNLMMAHGMGVMGPPLKF